MVNQVVHKFTLQVSNIFSECAVKPNKVQYEVAENWFCHFGSADETLKAYEFLKGTNFKASRAAAHHAFLALLRRALAPRPRTSTSSKALHFVAMC
jgi:hypothetical protein